MFLPPIQEIAHIYYCLTSKFHQLSGVTYPEVGTGVQMMGSGGACAVLLLSGVTYPEGVGT